MSRIAKSSITDTWYLVDEYDDKGDGKLVSKSKTELAGYPVGGWQKKAGNEAINADARNNPDGQCALGYLGIYKRCQNDAEYFHVDDEGNVIELCAEHAQEATDD